MAITSPSATAGEEAARRSIAPSISTCSAPSASIASLTVAQVLGGARAGDFDGAPLCEPRDHDLAERRSHSRLREPLVREAACAQQRVGARHEAAAPAGRSAASRSARRSRRAPRRRARSRSRRRACRAAACSRRIAASVSVLPVFFASPTSASRACWSSRSSSPQHRASSHRAGQLAGAARAMRARPARAR